MNVMTVCKKHKRSVCCKEKQESRNKEMKLIPRSVEEATSISDI